MTLKEKALDLISHWFYYYDPEPVNYIQRYDLHGNYIVEIDGDYCEKCANEKAKKLDIEHKNEYVHEVCVESMPENCYFSYCEECGCLLNADLITSDFAEDDINDLVDDLKTRVKTFEDLEGKYAWKIWQFFCSEHNFKKLFPKQMSYISRRITNLYKKMEEKNRKVIKYRLDFTAHKSIVIEVPNGVNSEDEAIKIAQHYLSGNNVITEWELDDEGIMQVDDNCEAVNHIDEEIN